MRFALVTDELPRPGFAGHLAVNYAIISWLKSGGHDVVILLLRPRLRRVIERYDDARVTGIGVRTFRHYVYAGGIGPAAAILGRRLIEFIPAKAAANLRKRLRRKRYGQADAVLGVFVTAEQSRWCAREILKLAPDAILADTIFRAPVLQEPALAQINSAIIAHDLFYLRHRALRLAGYTVHPAALTQEAEAALLNSAKVVAAIQPEEAALMHELCPGQEICTAPMPALPCARPQNTPRIAGRLVFVGSATLPNLDGLRWLFAEIWPLLRQACPWVTLDLVGDCGDGFSALPPGVRRLGRMKDLSAILHRSALAISPLRVGSGLKIKILDYARHGLFTVATAESLTGFAADAKAPFIAAIDAGSFAQAILDRLEADAADETRALHYVTKHYSVNACFAGLAAALNIPAPAIA